jgi:hypothetical protein
MMTLIYDDFDEVYIWVDSQDHNVELSPEYDDEASARQWYGKVAAIMLAEFGTKRHD